MRLPGGLYAIPGSYSGLTAGQVGKFISDSDPGDLLRRRSEWASLLFACDGEPKPPEALTKKTEPGDTGEHRVTFAAEIRRRRAG